MKPLTDAQRKVLENLDAIPIGAAGKIDYAVLGQLADQGLVRIAGAITDSGLAALQEARG